MAKLQSVVLDIAIDCPRCMRPIGLEEIRDRARCRACLFELPMPAERWKYVAESGVESALDGDESAGNRSVDFADGFTVVTRIRRGATLDVAPPAARPADALARAIHRKAVAVLGERAPEVIAAALPVSFRCPACHGTLRSDGTARAVACATCKADLDVPERLWDALHPLYPRATPVLVIGGGK